MKYCSQGESREKIKLDDGNDNDDDDDHYYHT
jgi:hypothetical protein